MTTKNLKPESGNRHALRAGFTIDEILGLTKVDRWFLVQIMEIVDFEEELAGARGEELSLRFDADRRLK